MAARVNTRFVLILVIVLALLAAMVAGGIFYVNYYNVGDRIARGDAALAAARQALAANDPAKAQENLEAALFEYRKAMPRRQEDIELKLKYVDVLELRQVSTSNDARSAISNILGFLNSILTLDPKREDIFNRLCTFYYRLGRELGDRSAWSTLIERCDKTLASFPNSIAGHKYRGIARVYMMQTIDVTPDRRQLAFDDLNIALQQNPKDFDALYHLAWWHLTEAQIIERAKLNQEKATENRQKVRDLMKQLARLEGEDPQHRIDRIRLLLDMKDTDGAIPELNKLEAQLLAKPATNRLALEVANLLINTDTEMVDQGPSLPTTTRGIQRAQAILAAAQKADARDIRIFYMIASLMASQGRSDDCLAMLDKALRMELSDRPFEALTLWNVRMECEVLRYDQLLSKAEQQTDPAQRQSMLDELAVNLNKSTIPEESVQRAALNGRLAMAQGRWAEAVSRLELANTRAREANPMILRLLATACLRQGDPGAAIARLKDALDRSPGMTDVRVQLAALQLQNKQIPDAQRNIEQVLAEQPRNPQALQLRAQLLNQSGDPKEAIAIYEKLDPQKNPDLIPGLAGLYIAAGRVEDARRILEQRFKDQASDLRLLQLLLRLSTSKEQAAKYIEQARQGGADKSQIELLMVGLEKPEQLGQALEDMLSKEPDPLRRALKRYNLFRQMDKLKEADEALAEANKLKPDDEDVLNYRFLRAVEQRAWEEAQAIVARATSLNLDLAQGQFFVGQLALAQNQLPKAIAALKRATTARPVYSEGWRLLGDAQRLSGELNESLAAYKKAVDQRPGNLNALRGMAESYDQLKEYGQAIQCYRAAIDFAPNDPLLLNQYLSYEESHGDPRLALNLRQKIAQADPTNYGNQRAIAVLHARLRDFALARQTLDAVIAKEGRTVANLAVLATLYSIQGQNDQAVAALRQYIEERGDKASAEDWLLLAKFFLSLDRGEDALAAFRRAIAVEDPSKQPASRELADLMFDRGLFEDALEYYQKLYNADPKDIRIGQRYVEALLRSDKVELAESILGKVVAQQGTEDATTWVLKGLVARARNDDAKAVEAMRKAVELAPRRDLFRYQYAEQLAAANTKERQKLAIDEITRALELNRTLIPARMLLARIRMQQRDPQEAIRELILTLKIAPNYVPARRMLADIYQSTNDIAALRSLLEESAKMFPKDTSWLRLQARVAQRDKDLTVAQRKLKEAVGIAPIPENIFDLAALYLTTNQTDQAMSLLQTHAELVARHPLLLAVLGRAHAVLKQPGQAESKFGEAFTSAKTMQQIMLVNEQAAAALGPARANEILRPMTLGNKGAWSQLAQAINLVGQDKYADAVKLLQDVNLLLTDAQERLIADRLTALSLHRSGQLDQARRKYEQILRDHPDDVPTINNLAYLLADNISQIREALRLANQAAEMAPRDAEVIDTQGWVLYKANMKTEALAKLRQSVELQPSAANQYHLGVVIIATGGSKPEAVRYFESALKLAEENKDSEIARLAREQLSNLKN